jgi:plasmid stability protein
MAELVICDVEEVVPCHLTERAARHGRTPAQEAKAILAEAVRCPSPDAWGTVDEIYQRRAASGQTFSDSADLLREDRDR